MADRVESSYGVRRLSIPLLGLAKGFVAVARPAGVRSVDLAVFENLRGVDGEEFHRLVAGSLSPAWKPVVRVRSRRDRESVSIFTRDAGKHIAFLIATCGPDEAVLVQAKAHPEELAKWLEDPDRIGGRLADGGDEDEP